MTPSNPAPKQTPGGALRAAVLGHPIGHSRSPLLHAAAYKALGVDIDYAAIDTQPEAAGRFAARLRTEPGWVGVSVTMPMKDALVPFLDERSDRVRRLGALNTIVVRHTDLGVRLFGHNTDVDGIVHSIRAASPAVTAGAERRAAILGAGNTALAALEACADLGFTHVDLVVRNPERAAQTLSLAAELGLIAATVSAVEAAELLHRYGAVISTLPAHAADPLCVTLGLQADPGLGLTPASELPQGAGILAPGAVLLDAAYDPWPSALASAWERAGGTVVSGLEMLVYQGVEQVKLFSGVHDADWDHVTNVMCDAVGLSRP